MTKEEAIKVVQESIDIAQNYVTVSTSAEKIPGMTTVKVKSFLNTLCSNISTYLEVGLFKGATFISAIEGNLNLTAIGCDNWSQFNGPKEQFAQNLAHAGPGAHVHIYDMDCYSTEFKTVLDTYPKFDVFFYDGDHSRLAQVRAVKLYKQIMPDVGIMIVDDWRKWGKKPTMDAVKTSGLTVVKTWELYDGWWEGVGVLILSKE